MPALSTWVASFHGATADAVTTAYETVALATVAAYSGYVTKDIFIVEPKHDWMFLGDGLLDVSRWQTKPLDVRQVFDILTWPFFYKTGLGDQDKSDYDELVAVLTSGALWVSVRGGSERWPSDATLVHPIILADTPSKSVNSKEGTRTYSIQLELKGIS